MSVQQRSLKYKYPGSAADYPEHQQRGHRGSLPYLQWLQSINGQSLCPRSLCAQFDKKSLIKPLPLSPKGHKHFDGEPLFSQQWGDKPK